MEDQPYLSARKVWERYGVTSMTLHRWQNDEAMGFPKPVYFGRLRFFVTEEIEAWEKTRAGKKSTAIVPKPRRKSKPRASAKSDISVDLRQEQTPDSMMWVAICRSGARDVAAQGQTPEDALTHLVLTMRAERNISEFLTPQHGG